MSGYIGTQPVPQATQTRDSFTCTAGQTSFATSGYTPSFLDVYLNGVKLTATDYTASNGSDVVLASGAAAGDVLEVVAFTAFEATNVTGATDFTVTGSFTSQGIDDNANSTVITIDSSERLKFGTTSNTPASAGVAGIVFGDNTAGTPKVGVASFSSDGAAPVLLTRLNSDGNILGLAKDGTTVGSIGTTGGGLVAGSTDSALYFHADNNIYPYNPSSSSYRNGDVDLGWSSGRFRDLYLSGGVYLGGVGSSNKLDDYEEGTWTPTARGGTTAGSATYNYRDGEYTKIGNIVYASCNMLATGFNGTGAFQITGLPFNMRSNQSAGLAVVQWNNSPFVTFSSDDQASVVGVLTANENTMGFRASDRSAGGSYTELQCGPTTIGYLRINVTYMTN